jgi:hypothetical protein
MARVGYFERNYYTSSLVHLALLTGFLLARERFPNPDVDAPCSEPVTLDSSEESSALELPEFSSHMRDLKQKRAYHIIYAIL